MTDNERRLRIRVLAASAAIIGTWLLVGWWIGPSAIRAAYEERSVAFLNGLFEGRDIHPVERYLAVWNRAAIALLLLLALAAIVVQALLPVRQRLSRLLDRVLRAEPTVSPAQAIGLAVSFGLLFGFTEYLQTEIKYRIDGVYSDWSNPDMLWMAPLAIAAFFTVGIVLLLLLTLSVRRPVSFRGLAALLFAAGIFGLLRALRVGIHPAGAIILAGGAGVALSRLVARRHAYVQRTAVRFGAAGIALAVAAGLAMHGFTAVRERLAIRALPAGAGSPDIVLLILDTVRAEQLGLYGYDRDTSPALDSVALAGILFRNAFAPSPWTLPAHASLFTGIEPSRLSTGWQSTLDATYPTLAERLAGLGYVNAGFVANLHYTTRRSGLARGFHHYRDYAVSVPTFLASTWITTAAANRSPGFSGNAARIVRKHAPDINAEFLDWHAAHDSSRPFFAFLNYFDAHDPYIAHDGFADRLGPPPADSVQNAERNLVARGQGSRDNADRYDSMIAFLDRHIGALLDSLRDRAALDRAWLFITSDHGEQFGEHGLTFHGNSLYSQLLRVPLIVIPPGGLDRPIEIDAPVSLVDLFPTLLAIAGADDTAANAGTSLLPMLDGVTPRAGAPIIAELDPNLHDRGLQPPLSHGPMKSIVDGPWHYVRNGNGTEELYDIFSDPSEYDDRSGFPAADSTLRRLRAALDALSLRGTAGVAVGGLVRRVEAEVGGGGSND
jgi:arylsulfatase A-like enzyme